MKKLKENILLIAFFGTLVTGLSFGALSNNVRQIWKGPAKLAVIDSIANEAHHEAHMLMHALEMTWETFRL